MNYRCVTTAVELGFDVRVVSCGGPVFVSGGRWAEYEECLTRAIPEQFINVVCGDEDERKRLYTEGVENVAIVRNGETTSRLYHVVVGEEGFRDFLTNILNRE